MFKAPGARVILYIADSILSLSCGKARSSEPSTWGLIWVSGKLVYVIEQMAIPYSGKISRKKMSRFCSKLNFSRFYFCDFQPPKDLLGRQNT